MKHAFLHKLCLGFGAVATSLLVASCGGNKQADAQSEQQPLYHYFPDYTFGVAINVNQHNGVDTLGARIAATQFNSIVPENCMKSEEIHPEEGRYYWDEADAFVAFGERNHQQIIGHCLIRHSQCAPWFFVDAEGKQVSAEVLKARMKEHITTVMQRYKGRITGWDVVNEAIVEDGSYRKSKFYEILGEEFIPLAFQYAHEADPDAELYYNDYGMNNPGRRAGVVKVIRQLKERGLRIDAVGLQSHMGMDYPDWGEFTASIEAFIAEGVDVQFTEVDMTALPVVTQSANVSDTEEYRKEMNPYTDGLAEEVSKEWNKRMTAFLDIVDHYKPHVKRVTVWGVTDTDSWKNDFPMKGRTDYPTFFDRQGNMKDFLKQRISGSQLWLNGETPKGETPKAVAEAELKQCWKGQMPELKIAEDMADLTEGSFRISSQGGKVTIEAAQEVGLLYGAYELIRMQNSGKDINNINVTREPSYGLRVINHWDNLNGTVERGYAGRSIFWTADGSVDEMRMAQYARASASVGINVVVPNNVNASPKVLSAEYLAKVKKMADIMRPFGIKMSLAINFASPMKLDNLATADPLNEEVQQWWNNKVKEIYGLIPDFAGFLVKANSEGEPGPNDFGRSHSEGANMLARALKPYNGIVMWRAFVYSPADPDRAKQAYLEFQPLDGQFDDNVIIQIKNGPIDFQPREAYSPLFGAMPKTRQMAELQITQEYLGHSNHTAYLPTMWQELFDQLIETKSGAQLTVSQSPKGALTAISGVSNVGNSASWCGNVLAQSNWYAFGRMAWDEKLTAEEIAAEWTAQTFRNLDAESQKTINQLLMRSREAVVDYMMPLGLHHQFAWGHHYGPEPYCVIPGARPDWLPSYYHKADKQGLGFNRSSKGSNATGQYAAVYGKLLDNPETCPAELILWFHHVAWNKQITHKCGAETYTETLFDALGRHYQQGLDEARAMQQQWETLNGKICPSVFADIQRRLAIQVKDAEWWKDGSMLYWQNFSKMPWPAVTEPAKHELSALKAAKLNISNYECPGEWMLDTQR